MDQINRTYFKYKQLPNKLQEVAEPFYVLMEGLDEMIYSSEEKEAGMRKLLEAKDCFFRAKLTHKQD